MMYGLLVRWMLHGKIVRRRRCRMARDDWWGSRRCGLVKLSFQLIRLGLQPNNFAFRQFCPARDSRQGRLQLGYLLLHRFGFLGSPAHEAHHQHFVRPQLRKRCATDLRRVWIRVHFPVAALAFGHWVIVLVQHIDDHLLPAWPCPVCRVVVGVTHARSVQGCNAIFCHRDRYLSLAHPRRSPASRAGVPNSARWSSGYVPPEGATRTAAQGSP